MELVHLQKENSRRPIGRLPTINPPGKTSVPIKSARFNPLATKPISQLRQVLGAPPEDVRRKRTTGVLFVFYESRGRP